MEIDKILSIPKSLWVSMHFFTLKDAIKLPILVRYNTKILTLKGEINVLGGVNRGMLSIGFGSVGLYDKRYQRSVLQLDGTIKLHGDSKVCIGHGSRICIGKNGCVTFGKNFINTAQMNICCVDSIVFGDDVVTSWDTLVMDTDWHSVRNVMTSEICCRTKPIVIGNGVWLCTKSLVLKGSYIPNGCIVGAGSLVNGYFEEENCLIAGNPGHVRKKHVTLNRDNKN